MRIVSQYVYSMKKVYKIDFRMCKYTRYPVRSLYSIGIHIQLIV